MDFGLRGKPFALAVFYGENVLRMAPFCLSLSKCLFVSMLQLKFNDCRRSCIFSAEMIFLPSFRPAGDDFLDLLVFRDFFYYFCIYSVLKWMDWGSLSSPPFC